MRKKWNDYWTTPLTRLSVLIECVVAYAIIFIGWIGYAVYIFKGDEIKKWFKTKLKKHYIETEIDR